MNFIKILGTSAGGGLPQWNCFCQYCGMARNGTIARRRQSSIALVNGKAQTYTLINASPDIYHQLLYFGETPGVIRRNPMKNIILTDAQLDHTLGLLNVREGEPLTIYATKLVQHQLTMEFNIFPLLGKYCSTNITTIEGPFSPLEDFEITPVDIVSNSPPYSIYRGKQSPGANLGLIIKSGDSKVFYAPGLKNITPEIEKIMSEVDHVLLDGTCWTSSELAFLNKPDLEELGHISQESLIHRLKDFSCRKTLIHINNTNPINDPDSPESMLLLDNGIEVAHDGMEIYL